MKILKITLLLFSLIGLATSVTFKTKTKSRKMQVAEEVLNSLKFFNNKYSNLHGSQLIKNYINFFK